jgi:hypothetical protein
MPINARIARISWLIKNAGAGDACGVKRGRVADSAGFSGSGRRSMPVGPFYFFAEFQHSSLSQEISGSLPVFCPERNYSVGQMGQAG